MIQEIALAQKASVHCGNSVCHWEDFKIAISIFHQHFKTVRPRIVNYYRTHQRTGSNGVDDSIYEIDHLGANRLVDLTSNILRHRNDGTFESTRGLEALVCSLSGFDTSDPRDTINAFLSICKEVNRKAARGREGAQDPPAPDYGKDLFEIYRDFVKWVVLTTGSLDILCRHWALKERQTCTATTPRLADLPSWILFVEDSAWGRGEDLLRGRKAGDSFVGLPGNSNYNASGTGVRRTQQSNAVFPEPSPLHQKMKQRGKVQGDATSKEQFTHDTSLSVTGIKLGKITFRTDPFPDGVITKDCLEGLGWRFDRDATEISDIPDQLWQTLVADRDPDGKPTPPWYKGACKWCLTHQTNNGHINIGTILRDRCEENDIIRSYLQRVRAVTWNRCFLKRDPSDDEDLSCGQDHLVGFGPPNTSMGDVVAVLFGCSVPVILRPVYSALKILSGYEFIGEAYNYGKMDGEALDQDRNETVFKLL